VKKYFFLANLMDVVHDVQTTIKKENRGFGGCNFFVVFADEITTINNRTWVFVTICQGLWTLLHDH
jgi:hypothetical protein